MARFEVDWTLDRTRGTCYVLLPSITGQSGGALHYAISQAYHGTNPDDFVFPNTDPNFSSIGKEASKRVAASYGRVNLDAFGDLVPEVGYPIPKVHSLGNSGLGSDSHRSIWTCRSSNYELVPEQEKPYRARAFAADEQFPGDSGCGGFAVISASPSEPFNTVALILVGVFLSLMAELGIEALRRRRILGP